jgi:hypothetical protein
LGFMELEEEKRSRGIVSGTFREASGIGHEESLVLMRRLRLMPCSIGGAKGDRSKRGHSTFLCWWGILGAPY